MSTTASKTSATAISTNFSVPIHVTNLSAFDSAFANMKENFAAEIKRLDVEMVKLSNDLLHLYGQGTLQAGMTSSKNENPGVTWDVITKSPLVEGEGDDWMLKLQFDVSKYEPNEVSVKICNNMLIISAVHQAKTDETSQDEYIREFSLPLGTNPKSVESSITTDGILTVRAPLHIDATKIVSKN